MSSVPWTHSRPTRGSSRIGDFDFGDAAGFDAQHAMERWFDRWLNGKPAESPDPPVRIFVMGIDKWRDEREWPLARARNALLPAQPSRANTSDGDGVLSVTAPSDESVDRYEYDPRDPVPTGSAGGYHGVRLSCHRFRANAFRLQLHSLALLLLAYFRRDVLAGTRLATATIGTIRLQLLKVAGRVCRSVRRLWFHLASHWPGQPLFTSCHRALARAPA